MKLLIHSQTSGWVTFKWKFGVYPLECQPRKYTLQQIRRLSPCRCPTTLSGDTMLTEEFVHIFFSVSSDSNGHLVSTRWRQSDGRMRYRETYQRHRIYSISLVCFRQQYPEPIISIKLINEVNKQPKGLNTNIMIIFNQYFAYECHETS